MQLDVDEHRRSEIPHQGDRPRPRAGEQLHTDLEPANSVHPGRMRAGPPPRRRRRRALPAPDSRGTRSRLPGCDPSMVCDPITPVTLAREPPDRDRPATRFQRLPRRPRLTRVLFPTRARRGWSPAPPWPESWRSASPAFSPPGASGRRARPLDLAPIPPGLRPWRTHGGGTNPPTRPGSAVRLRAQRGLRSPQRRWRPP